MKDQKDIDPLDGAIQIVTGVMAVAVGWMVAGAEIYHLRESGAFNRKSPPAVESCADKRCGDFDLSVFKNNYIHRERVNIQFRAELFNALNHANFAVPSRTAAQIFTQTFSPVTTAGLLTTTSTTSRQIQLALKCIF